MYNFNYLARLRELITLDEPLWFLSILLEHEFTVVLLRQLSVSFSKEKGSLNHHKCSLFALQFEG